MHTILVTYLVVHETLLKHQYNEIYYNTLIQQLLDISGRQDFLTLQKLKDPKDLLNFQVFIHLKIVINLTH